MDGFWKRVNELIKHSGITQEILAETIGISKNTLYSWIAQNRQPRAIEAYKIAQSLGVSVEYLVTGQEPVTKPHLNSVKAHLQQALTELDRI